MKCQIINFRPHGIDYSQRVVDEKFPDTEPEDSTSTEESSTILTEDATELQITEEEQFSNSTTS